MSSQKRRVLLAVWTLLAPWALATHSQNTARERTKEDASTSDTPYFSETPADLLGTEFARFLKAIEKGEVPTHEALERGLQNDHRLYCENDELKSTRATLLAAIEKGPNQHQALFAEILEKRAQFDLEQAVDKLSYPDIFEVVYHYPKTEAAKQAYLMLIRNFVDHTDCQMALEFSKLLQKEHSTLSAEEWIPVATAEILCAEEKDWSFPKTHSEKVSMGGKQGTYAEAVELLKASFPVEWRAELNHQYKKSQNEISDVLLFPTSENATKRQWLLRLLSLGATPYDPDDFDLFAGCGGLNLRAHLSNLPGDKVLELLETLGTNPHSLPYFIEHLGSESLLVYGTLPDMIASYFGEEAIPQVVQATKDKRPRVRANAYKTLAFIGKGLRPILSDIIRGLSDEDEDVQEYAMWALALVRPIETLLPLATSEQPHKIRLGAIRAMSTYPLEAQKLVPQFIEMLGNKKEDPEILTQLLDTLQRRDFPEAAKENVKPLYDHQNAEVRRRAIEYSAVWVKKDNRVFSEIKKHLDDRDDKVRAQAVGSLVDGGRQNEIAGELIRLASDPSALVRSHALRGLAGLSPPPPVALELALDTVQRDPVNIEAACAVLRAMKLPDIAIPVLIEKLGTASNDLPVFSALKVDAKRSVPALIEILKDQKRKQLHRGAIRMLALFGREAKDAVPFLETLTESGDPKTANAALSALTKIKN